MFPVVNPFVPNPRLSVRLSEGIEKGCIGNKWIKFFFSLQTVTGVFKTQSNIYDRLSFLQKLLTAESR